jgi:hypothetical protein
MSQNEQMITPTILISSESNKQTTAPKIFISSTVYDLKDLRASLILLLQNAGFGVIASFEQRSLENSNSAAKIEGFYAKVLDQYSATSGLKSRHSNGSTSKTPQKKTYRRSR